MGQFFELEDILGFQCEDLFLGSRYVSSVQMRN
jgi:hypothetical protein